MSYRFLTTLLRFSVLATMLLPLATAQSVAGAARTYGSPEEAMAALVTAAKAEDVEGLCAIFGNEYRHLIVTEDPAQDAEVRKLFIERCGESCTIQRQEDGSAVMIIGTEAWPFPIPLAESEGQWSFDAAAGAEEVANRRIGENELEAIEACRAYILAQVQYASADRDADGVLEYAQKLASSTGQQDGLYWEADVDAGEEASPFGPLLAEAGGYGQARQQGDPWYGYRFRILTRQGDHPPGGAHNYIINGNMVVGFALLAWPAEYGASGITTFLVSHHGRIYEKDLGEATEEIVEYINEFDPGDGWSLVESE